jgi:hypothetical protein
MKAYVALGIQKHRNSFSIYTTLASIEKLRLCLLNLQYLYIY